MINPFFVSLGKVCGRNLAISGADDAEQQRDGDFLNKDERYARTDEYVGLLRRLWTSEAPFDHEGRYYRFKGGFQGRFRFGEAGAKAAYSHILRRLFGGSD